MSTRSGRSFVYERVVELLTQRLRDGTYAVGDYIPGEQSLADELGVSRPSVKRAVEELEAAGLVQCRAAVGTRVLRRPGVTGLIGYISPTLGDPFQAEAVQAMEAALRTRGTGLLVAESGADLSLEVPAAERLSRHGAAGLVICGGPTSDWQRLRALPIPVVWFGGGPETDAMDRVHVDDAGGMCLVLAHLREIGVTRVGYAGASCPGIAPDLDDRWQAWRLHIEELGFQTMPEWQILHPGLGEAAGEAIMSQFLERPSLPEAIVCCDDWTAIGLLSRADRAGLAIPGDLKVTGFDNLLISRYLPAPLTTIDYPLPAMAEIALDLLDARVASPEVPPSLHRLPGRLMVRASTAG